MKKSVLSKKLTKPIIGITLLTGVVVGCVYNHDTKVVKANETTLKDSIKTLSSIYDKDGVFFTKSYNEVEKTLNQLKSVPDTLDGVIVINNKGKTETLHKNLNEEVKVATKKLNIWNKINTIYNKEVDLSKKNNNLIADVSKMVDSKDLNKELDIESNENSKFKEHVMFYINLANEQKQDFENAKKAVDKVYKDNKVLSTNKKDIDFAKDSINKIKDLELKKSLLKDLEAPQKQYEKEEQERVAKEKAEAEKAEQERIAKEKAEVEKAEQERIAKEKAEAEQAKKVEQERLSKETSEQKQDVKVEQETVKKENPIKSNPQTTAPQQNTNNSAVSQTQSIPSSGVYINGVSSPIGTYNQNGGQVPINTNMAYLWAIGDGVPNNYYLIDYTNSVGLGVQVLALKTGDSVYINGHKYSVVGNQTVYPGQSTDTLDWNHSAFLQTCYSSAGGSSMKLVYLD